MGDSDTRIDTLAPPKSKKNPLTLALKIVVTIGIIWLIIAKADIEQIKTIIAGASWEYLLATYLVLHMGQITSAFRMRYYFGHNGVPMGRHFSAALYYIGMLFNLILPGGIGGDGYKAYYLKMRRDYSFLSGVRVLLTSRTNGLAMLIAMTIILGLLSADLRALPGVTLLFIIGLVALFPSYAILSKRIWKEPFHVQNGAYPYSFAIQLLNFFAAYLLLQSVSAESHILEYLFLFGLSSFLMIMPITIGGIGIREASLYFGSTLLGMNPELGIVIGVLYFFTNGLASLTGVYYFYRIGRME